MYGLIDPRTGDPMGSEDTENVSPRMTEANIVSVPLQNQLAVLRVLRVSVVKIAVAVHRRNV
jgi:hypothetical protein